LKFLKEIYGVGIIFFYYVKWPVLIGWPILRFALDYPPNILMDLFWLLCLLLAIKDIAALILKKR